MDDLERQRSQLCGAIRENQMERSRVVRLAGELAAEAFPGMVRRGDLRVFVGGRWSAAVVTLKRTTDKGARLKWQRRGGWSPVSKGGRLALDEHTSYAIEPPLEAEGGATAEPPTLGITPVDRPELRLRAAEGALAHKPRASHSSAQQHI